LLKYRDTVAKVNLNHLKHNVRTLRSLLQNGQFFCPMVKANAYGHGDVEVVKALIEESVGAVGVALTEEGVRLRESNLHSPDILVFSHFSEDSLQACIQNRLTPVLSSWDELKKLDSLALSGFPVHLKFDTGMHRLGFSPQEAQPLFDFFNRNTKVKLQGICTHLFDAEDGFISDGNSDLQMRQFSQIDALWSGKEIHRHVFNSAGLLALNCTKNKQWQGVENWGARPGIAMYGSKPVLSNISGDLEGELANIELRQVMTWLTAPAQVHSLKAGDTVSYGAKWKASKDSHIAVLPLGYADGFHRSLSNLGKVYARGQLLPVVGTVCMDYIMVDATELKLSDEELLQCQIEIFGENQSADEMAKLIETISYELFTSVSTRVPREVVES
jgi:alanine racemase